MALVFTVNQLPATGADAVYRFKAALKATGPWTVPRSSDGQPGGYNPAGDAITHGGAGANGMANDLAWFVVQEPSGGRQLCFQRMAGSNTSWRTKYSLSAGFTGGAPGDTQVPSATDEEVLYGGGTDGAPTGDALFGADASYNQHVAVVDAAPWGFWSVGYPAGGGNPNHWMMLDPVTQPSGSDADQRVLMLSGNAPLTGGASSDLVTAHATYSPKGWLKHGLGGADFVVVPGCYYMQQGGAHVAFPDGAGTNPHDAKDDALPVVYARGANLAVPVGYKGISTLLKVRGVVRATGDTGTVAAAKDRIYLGQYVAGWDGATTPNV